MVANAISAITTGVPNSTIIPAPMLAPITAADAAPSTLSFGFEFAKHDCGGRGVPFHE